MRNLSISMPCAGRTRRLWPMSSSVAGVGRAGALALLWLWSRPSLMRLVFRTFFAPAAVARVDVLTGITHAIIGRLNWRGFIGCSTSCAIATRGSTWRLRLRGTSRMFGRGIRATTFRRRDWRSRVAAVVSCGGSKQRCDTLPHAALQAGWRRWRPRLARASSRQVEI